MAQDQLLKFWVVKKICDLGEFLKPNTQKNDKFIVIEEEQDILDCMEQAQMDISNKRNIFEKEILWPNYDFEQFCKGQQIENLQYLFNSFAQTKVQKYQSFYEKMMKVFDIYPSYCKVVLTECWEDVCVNLRKIMNSIFV